jgi:hypothetical protein
MGFVLILTLLFWSTWVGAHQGELSIRHRRGTEVASQGSIIASDDTVYYTGFEPGDPVGVNVDYNAKASPDEWHVTKEMLYHSASPWWVTAAQDSYFCHIGDDSLGYSDGNEVGYQIQFDLTNYSDAGLYYLSAMQAYDQGDVFDKFAVWGQHDGMGDSWYNLDPGEGSAWGGDWYGDWGVMWWPPDEDIIPLTDLAGHSGVIIEFWFLSDSGDPQGFGVAIDEILVTGTPATGVQGHQEHDAVPRGYRLYAPYPNPFNAQVNIRYVLPREAPVKLDIYNLRGQRVRSLVDGNAPQGEHIVAWDGRDETGHQAASGVYVCHLWTGGLSMCEKVVLLR